MKTEQFTKKSEYFQNTFEMFSKHLNAPKHFGMFPKHLNISEHFEIFSKTSKSSGTLWNVSEEFESFSE